MRYVLSLGSNIGDGEEALASARKAIGLVEKTTVAKASSVYVTKPWGKEDQPDFLNQVVFVDSDIEPESFLKRMLQIETHLGRVRKEKWGPRCIDIDLIAAGKRNINTGDLILPHKHAHERAFVLVPWLELDPEAELPRWGRIADLVEKIGADTVLRHDA